MKNAPPDRTIEDYFLAPDIHEVQRQTSGGLLALVVGTVLCLVESLMMQAVLNDHISFWFALLVHLILTAALALGVFVLPQDSGEKRFIILLALAFSMTGPFGAGGVVLAVLNYFWGVRHATSFEEWFESIFPHTPRSTAQRIESDILLGRDESASHYSVIPFLDVMSYGSEIQKRRALAKMTSNFHPSFASAFRKALNDKSNMIRVLAATGISRIESQFLERLMKLAEINARHGKEPVVVWSLAEHYDNYAYTGLLDFDREQINRQKALEYYQAYLQLQPHDALVRTRIGRILMRNKEYEKACDWFRQCIEQGYVSEAITQWYSEALFNCGRYADLRRLRAPLSSAAANNGFQDSFTLWAGAKA